MARAAANRARSRLFTIGGAALILLYSLGPFLWR